MFITTAGRTDEMMIKETKRIANELNIPYVKRKKSSLHELQQINVDDCMVVGKERIELYFCKKDKPFFFHPNSASFRIKRLLQGEHDPFLKATQLKHGMSLLDCTLGLASDSIVASYIVGSSGKVVGIEGNPYLAYLVRRGLSSWNSSMCEMNMAMKNITVIHSYFEDYLRSLNDCSFDCVYFDPMFDQAILQSDGIARLRDWAIYTELTESVIKEAKRVAKHRIVIKEHFRSEQFERFGFERMARKTSKFHFGFIEL
ncbi:putative methyltransferase [Oikeobacillus pervagus]|uniref:Methyltransferase n=1 Tax=Oikeobacillus pervagus TaxID=1325931 RepID=A0AAJ1WJU9_9BACI|nr:class I SAM-dependent methyltransferase [Oikeobacillus pervagus]MDQ0215853.1 putative methyltransferase [Oikeobacillus pervagus]